MRWELRAGCKVNLYLDIVGVRADGYHEIESLFYPLPVPYDSMMLDETDGSGLQLTCSDPALAAGDNILTRTYAAFAAATGCAPGLTVHLVKHIPMGAGLGGGSSDAAALLGWLNAQVGTCRLNDQDLVKLAQGLGADVPFFLLNTPAWVTGIGETVCPVTLDLAAHAILLVCPGVRVNTAWAYRRWDECNKPELLSVRKVLTATGRPNKEFCFTKAPVLHNCFEEVVFREFPNLYELKTEILRCGAQACVMSGSGSSMVSLFESLDRALACGRLMRGNGCLSYVVKGQDVFQL